MFQSKHEQVTQEIPQVTQEVWLFLDLGTQIVVMSLQHGCFLGHMFTVLTGILGQMTEIMTET